MSLANNALLSAACLGMAVFVNGCGPSPSSSSGAVSAAKTLVAPAKPPAPNACDVLDETTAKKYFGASAHLTRKAQPNPHMSQCQYAGPKGQITIMVGDWSFVHVATPLDKPKTGLGDEAIDGAGGLYVRKGDRGVSINVSVESGEFSGSAADSIEAQNLAAEVKIAPDLLARL